MNDAKLSPYLNRILHGDCREVLTQLPDACVDLIITSPPYADQRKEVYGGIHPDRYVEWFLPIAAELKRVLKPTGSFVLNIKERVVNGEYRFNSRAGSGFGKRVANWIGRKYAYPINVLHMATECYNRYHAATFPVELPA